MIGCHVPVAGRAADRNTGIFQRDTAGRNIPCRVGAVESTIGVIGQQQRMGLSAVIQHDALRMLRQQGNEGLDLFLFADTMEQEKETTGRNGDNHIYLNGFLCKPPYFRIKKTSGRHITDLLLAVNRPYGKSDYIPVLAWGRLADLTAGCQVGDRIAVNGRIQSRTYQKKRADGTVETREVYEISGSRVIRENGRAMEEKEDA